MSGQRVKEQKEMKWNGKKVKLVASDRSRIDPGIGQVVFHLSKAQFVQSDALRHLRIGSNVTQPVIVLQIVLAAC